jgi:mono/diheme cytochrome c family protein
MNFVSAFLSFVIILCSAAAHAQIYPGYMRQETPMLSENIASHRYVKLHGIPTKYRDYRNPLTASEGILAEGARIYGERCAPCHGNRGNGDGPRAKDLSPPPSPLASSVRMPIAGDSYLFWAIADGGAETKTAMPAFRDVMGDGDIWKLILYLRLRTWTSGGTK